MADIYVHWTQVLGDQFQDGRRLREAEAEVALCEFLDQHFSQPSLHLLRIKPAVAMKPMSSGAGP